MTLLPRMWGICLLWRGDRSNSFADPKRRSLEPTNSCDVGWALVLILDGGGDGKLRGLAKSGLGIRETWTENINTIRH